MMRHAASITTLAVLATLIGLLAPSQALPQTVPGPVAAKVVRVIDGDTLVVDAYIWVQQSVIGTSIRVDGIDTPERRGKCEHEKQLAQRAKQMMSDLFAPGASVELRNVRNGKFAGRFIADVARPDGLDWADHITSAGLATAYEGRGPKTDWCNYQFE